MWSKSAPLAQLMRVAPKKAKIATMPTGKTGGVLTAPVFGELAIGCGSGGGGGSGTGGT